LTEGRSHHISNMGTLLRHSVTRALGHQVLNSSGGTVGVASKIGSKRAFHCEHWSKLSYCNVIFPILWFTM